MFVSIAVIPSRVAGMTEAGRILPRSFQSQLRPSLRHGRGFYYSNISMIQSYTSHAVIETF